MRTPRLLRKLFFLTAVFVFLFSGGQASAAPCVDSLTDPLAKNTVTCEASIIYQDTGGSDLKECWYKITHSVDGLLADWLKDGPEDGCFGSSYAKTFIIGPAPAYCSHAGICTLFFEAKDGAGNLRGEGNKSYNVDFNAKPVLSWTGEVNYISDGLDPEIGKSSTGFSYHIKYTDADNNAPNFVKVHIKKPGETEIIGLMSYVSGTYSGGAIYYFVKSGLTTGADYTYYFEARDSKGADSGRYPATDVDAPDIDNLPVASISRSPARVNVMGQTNDTLSINVSGSSDDLGITGVRFSSDESQDGNCAGNWNPSVGYYSWSSSLGDWNYTTKVMSWKFSTPGAKEACVEVSDTSSQTNRAVANVSVNSSPTANAGTDRNTFESRGVILDGSGSDSDGTIASYGWFCPKGALSDSKIASPTHALPAVDVDTTYKCSLTVTDNDGAVSFPDEVSITVRNSPPTFILKPSWAAIFTGKTQQLDAEYDSDGPDGGAASLMVDRALVAWSSLDSSIAAVSNYGLVTGVAAGITTIEG
ncbi:MAG: PKD domain-containing protein, partial [bacterium]|nr:PKD domain-containing protein [bacterium]